MVRFNKLPQNSNISNRYIDPILVEIFSGEQNSLDKQLMYLVVENQAMGGTMNAFTTTDGISAVVPHSTLRGVKIAPLHMSLMSMYDRYKTRSTKLKKDMKKIRHALSMVLSKCTHEQDIRDIIPDVIANKVPELKGIPRHREEGFILIDRPSLLKQFNDSMEIAFFYQANRLMD